MINTTQTLSAEMQTYYEKTLIDNVEPKLVYDTLPINTPYLKMVVKLYNSGALLPLLKPFNLLQRA